MKQKRLFNKFLPLLMLIVCSILGTTDAWASTTYYAKVTAKLSTKNESGSGKVYASTASTANASVDASAWKTDANGSTAQNTNTDAQVTLYINAMANPGYVFKGWSKTDGNTDLGTASPYTVNSGTSGISTSSRNGYTECGPFYARFVPFTFGDATPASVNIADAYAKHTYEGSVVIETNEATAIGNFNTPTITTTAGSGTFSYVSQTWAGGNLTINYRFNANGFVGTTTATLTAKTAGDVRTKDITLTATTVAPTITAEDPTQLTPSTPTSLAEGTATFNVTNAEDASYFAAPTFTNVQGGGTWKVVSTSYAAGVYTVNYTFQSDASHLGDHSADLTLTATIGSATKTVTATAFTEAEKDYDVEVFNKTGVSIYQGNWATAVSTANANEGSTIQLARNVDLGVLSTHGANITVNTTLDLAGKTLSATCNTKDRYTIYLTKANKTLTITDSKNGGTIRTTGSYNGVIYCVGASAGSIIMNGGTISHENTMTYASGSSVQTRAVQIAANANFTLNDGEITAEGGNQVYGIRKEGSATATGVVHINGGVINANCKRQYAYGIYTLAKLYVDGGTINAKTYTSTGISDAYGIDVAASANMNAASEYMGELFMTAGTVNATTQTSGAYAVGVVGATTPGTKYTDDGTYYLSANRRAYPSQATISGGTFNATTTTSGAYGLFVSGSVRSVADEYDHTMDKPTVVTGGTFNATAKTSGAYGIFAQAESSWAYACLKYGIVEASNVTCNAKTGTKDAYGAYVASNSKRWAEGAASTSWNTSYPFRDRKDEYTVAAKMTIHSGTFTGTASTTGGCGVCSATRAIALSGDYDNQAYPELIINGGTFVGKTEGASATTTAYGIYSGGYTTVTGGEFTALPNTTTAYAAYINAGKLTMSNAKLTATATASAYGVYVNAGVADVTGVETFGEVELNNLDVTATTTTGNEADGVRVITAAKTVATGTEWNRHPGEYACAANAIVNGGIYKVKSAGTTAYGLCTNTPGITGAGNAVGMPELVAKNATISAETKGGKNSYGVSAGGPVVLEKCDISSISFAETAYGVLAHNTTKITDCNISGTATTSAYGVFANIINNYTTNDKQYAADVTIDGGTINATTTTGNTARALYVERTTHTLTQAEYDKITHTTYPYPYVGEVTGIAASAIVNDGEFSVSCAGTGGHAVFVNKTSTVGTFSATPKCAINGGKYKGKEADINADGSVGDFVINNGYFVQDANIAKYTASDKFVFSLSAGPEYSAGYRYVVSDQNPGGEVCKIYNGNTNVGSYASLEEALQYVNANPGTTLTIVMTGHYTLPAGNYILPEKATLLVPYMTGTGKGATSALETSVSRTNKAATPSVFKKLILADGANLTVKGRIEVSAQMLCANGGDAISGCPTGPYGQIHMSEGARIDLEAGAIIYAWGYITGKGLINAKSNSRIYEDFQLGYWRGGSASSAMLNNDAKAFFVTDYAIQNIECPIIYRAGATSLAYSGVYAASGIRTCDNVRIIGTDNSFFTMTNSAESADTWVRKEYNAAEDRVYWTMNSGASISNINITLSNIPLIGNISMDSKDYNLPITTNFTITLNEGKLNLTNNMLFMPGSKLIVNKEATAVVATGKKVYFYDSDDWSTTGGKYYYPATYSPSWGDKNPRVAIHPQTSPLPDAEVFVHGAIECNGQLFTTGNGSKGSANIHSTNADAGTIVYTAAATADGTVGQCTSTKPDYVYASTTSAQLKNGDGTYTQTSGTQAGYVYEYENDQWVCRRQDGCMTVSTDGSGEHYYAKPSDVVEVAPNATDEAYHSVADPTRFFIFAENNVKNNATVATNSSCFWWEVEHIGVIDGVNYYMANQEQFDNYGTYYYFDNNVGYWTPKYVTVTWVNWDGSQLKYSNGTSAIDNVPFNTSPKYLAQNPTRANDATWQYAWTGWTFADDPEGLVYDKFATLPVVTNNVTIKAVIEGEKWKYTVTFKRQDGTKIEDQLLEAGAIPVCSVTPTMQPTVSTEYTFANWQGFAAGAQLPAVTAATTYVALFNSTTRKYPITFYDYDAQTILSVVNADYGSAPAYDKYEPVRERTNAYSYDFVGWQAKNGTIYAKGEALPNVSGEAYYIANFSQAGRRYQVILDATTNGGTCAVPFIERAYEDVLGDDMPVAVKSGYNFKGWYTAASGGTKVDASTEVTEDVTYYAQFGIQQYSVSWDAAGGTLTGDYTNGLVDYGTRIVAPTISKTGYDFAGWGDIPETVTGNVSLTANWTPITYAITYTGLEGASNSNPTSYTIESATINFVNPGERTGYTFDGWSPTSIATGSTGDKTIEASWTIKQYDITWKNEDGTTLTTTKVNYNVLPTYTGATPTKAATAQYSYTFTGWTPAIAAATANATYTATYSSTTNKYTVTWTDENDNVLGSDEVEFGVLPTHADLTKAETAEYTYTWKGWDNEVVAVSGSVTYKSLGFTATPKSYTLTWNLNGGEVKTAGTAAGSVAFGTELTAPVVEKTGYTFDGWNPTVPATMPAANATYAAQWIANEFTITFNTDGGSAVESITAIAGDPVSAPENPTKDGYTFVEWIPAVPSVMPMENVVCVAQWSKNSEDMIVSDKQTIEENTVIPNLTITEHGSVTIVGSANVTVVNNLVLEAVPDANLGAVLSGNIEVQGNAYIDIEMNKSGKMDDKLYYSFAVPFNVNTNGGVYRKVGDDYVEAKTWGYPGITDYRKVDYIAYTYDEAERATNGMTDDCWKVVNHGDVLVPGKFYMIQFANSNANVYRFEWNHDGELNNQNPIAVTTTGNDELNSGWHGVANNGLGYNTLSGSFRIMQTLNSAESKFDNYTKSNALAMGKPAFVQMANGIITVGDSAPASVARRVATNTAEQTLMEVEIRKEGAATVADKMFLTASEDALNEYEMGKDVAKMFMGTPKVAQMWVNAYGTELVANDAQLIDNQATYDLSIFAPAAGNYVISLASEYSADEQLYLTENGLPIFNLSLYDYTMQLPAGTSNTYGLLLTRRVSNVTTSIEGATEGTTISVEKVLMDGKMYIITGEHVFDAQGKMVK